MGLVGVEFSIDGMVQEDLIWADLLLPIVYRLENMRLNLMKSLSLMMKSATVLVELSETMLYETCHLENMIY